jgi:hypothetical protein
MTLVLVAIVVALLGAPGAVPAFVDPVESTCCDSIGGRLSQRFAQACHPLVCSSEGLRSLDVP